MVELMEKQELCGMQSRLSVLYRKIELNTETRQKLKPPMPTNWRGSAYVSLLLVAGEPMKTNKCMSACDGSSSPCSSLGEVLAY